MRRIKQHAGSGVHNKETGMRYCEECDVCRLFVQPVLPGKCVRSLDPNGMRSPSETENGSEKK